LIGQSPDPVGGYALDIQIWYLAESHSAPSKNRILMMGVLWLWQFTETEGEKFKKVCAVFCEDQSRALEVLRAKQHGNKDQKDQRLTQILRVICHSFLSVLFIEYSKQYTMQVD